MQTRQLGDVQVGAIGLGAMPLTEDSRPSQTDAIATVHAALEAGVTLIDTADAYTPSDHGPGLNEEVVARALSTYAGARDQVLVATKGGHTRDGGDWGLNGRPDYLRHACEQSLRRLAVESLDLYQHHRPDPDVPYAETMGGLKELYDAGLIQRAGISNADPDQIRTAHAILGGALVSVQNQFSPAFRSSEPRSRYAPSWGWPSCPGARSGAAAAPRTSVPPTPPSKRSPTPTTSARNGSASPGSWRCRSAYCRFPVPVARRRSRTRRRPLSSPSATTRSPGCPPPDGWTSGRSGRPTFSGSSTCPRREAELACTGRSRWECRLVGYAESCPPRPGKHHTRQGRSGGTV